MEIAEPARQIDGQALTAAKINIRTRLDFVPNALINRDYLKSRPTLQAVGRYDYVKEGAMQGSTRASRYALESLVEF